MLRTNFALWISYDEGDSFVSAINNSAYVRDIVLSSDDNHFFIYAGDVVYTTSDLGKHWTERAQPNMRLISGTFRPHEQNTKWVIALGHLQGSIDKNLYMSTDFGVTWAPLLLGVRRCDWHKTHLNDMTIVCWDANSRIMISDNLFATPGRVVADNVLGFVGTKDNLFYATDAPEVDRDGIALWVTNDVGETHMRVKFPKSVTENAYRILQYDEGFAFVSVIENIYQKWENVYASNSYFNDFSLSLEHAARSYRGSQFDRIAGIEGIYVANVADVNEEGEVSPTDSYTVFSYDKGGSWERPRVCLEDSDDCFINLHSPAEYRFRGWKTRSEAIGIMLSTGNTGKYLSRDADEVNTYISRDAGWTWSMIKNESHIYEVSNGGALIVSTSDEYDTSVLSYSWNEGLHWVDCQFSDVC